ncbi:MAG: aminotransferase class I/II-fold pyridoxal phosphate-dependent enzyme [Schleiferiaceae bacterium]|jgi:cystathionine beta-lyase|nr:aminotransferase class I/II-fold pyridoxal phosphate-dependent enzyme [Schleiferiaceae bacterium]
MHNFNSTNAELENKFVKNNKQILNHFFKTSDVESFWIADMDFEIAEPIKKEIQRLANRNVYAYEFSSSEMFEAMHNWFKRRHQLDLNANHFIQLPSVISGISMLISEYTQEGDGILIQTPVYHMFNTLINNINRKVINNPLIYAKGEYSIDFKDLEEKFASGEVKMMLFCNPHNPIGKVWTKEDVEKILALSNRYNVRLISDEIHGDITFLDRHYCSLMSLDAKDHFALIGSTAKTFGMQSISNGFIYIPSAANFSKMKQKVSGMFLDHGNTFTTFATIAAYKHGEEWVEELKIYLIEIIHLIQTFLQKELPQVKVIPVEGTYQMWLDFSGLGYSSSELKERILNNAKIGLAFGDWFDKSGNHDQFARFNFASRKDKIEKALNTLKTALVEDHGSK